MINDDSCRHDEDHLGKNEEEYLALYRQMQAPEHREACRKLFEASADDLNATYRQNDLVVTPAHIRAGLKWFFGNFSLTIDVSKNEAAALLNSTTDKLTCLQSQLSDAEAMELLPETLERLSLLLGIYGAIARTAPNGPSRFIYVAFREAKSSAYGECTLIEHLLNASSPETWYAIRSHLRTIEAEFHG